MHRTSAETTERSLSTSACLLYRDIIWRKNATDSDMILIEVVQFMWRFSFDVVSKCNHGGQNESMVKDSAHKGDRSRTPRQAIYDLSPGCSGASRYGLVEGQQDRPSSA